MFKIHAGSMYLLSIVFVSDVALKGIGVSMYSDRIQAKLFAKFRRTSMFDIRVFYLCTEYSITSFFTKNLETASSSTGFF